MVDFFTSPEGGRACLMNLMTHKTCIFRTKFEIPVPYKSTYSKLRHVYSYLDRCLLNILLQKAEQQIS